jgi:hypothetical protein
LNVSGIVIGGIVGLAKKAPLSTANQNFLKVALGAFTALSGLGLTWISLNGPFPHWIKQLAIAVVALAIGRVVGRLLHLQKASNRLGQFARERIAGTKPDDPGRFTEGFQVCSALFCAAPLGILGSICDGLPVHDSTSGYFYPLAAKAAMDGLATMGFVGMFGWGAVLSAVPVLVFQGTMTLLCMRYLQPVLGTALIDSINATGGLLIFCVALLIFEIRKIEVTGYLPSLLLAPLLTWLLRG